MKLYDTLSQSLKEIEVDEDQPLKLYSCGPTVYDYPHLGNWYAFLRWDLLVRSLKFQKVNLVWVMNVTDVGHLMSDADDGEDKLVVKAQKENKTAQDLAQFYTDYFLKSLKKLNFITPDHLPKASQHIKQQIDLILKLEQKGLTYLIDDGLYYDTSQLSDYGKLTHLQPQDLQLQSRLKVNLQKRQPTDFALWKLTPLGQKRDMEWDSPWGRGFPGWHLECSAMCHHYLGPTIDIHMGGIDHIPTHHTNELAQSEAAFEKPLAKIWLHSNFVVINNQKMSKSLNNFYTLEDIEKRGYNVATLRLAVFGSRYSNLANFTWSLMDANQKRWQKITLLVQRQFQLQDDDLDFIKHQKILEQTLKNIQEALNDNLNSPLALKYLETVCQKLSLMSLSKKLLNSLKDFYQAIDDLFGLKLTQIIDLTDDQKQILSRRRQARLNKDYLQADSLRQQLLEQKIAIFDTDFAQIWHRQA